LATLQRFSKPFLEVIIALEWNKPKALRITGYFLHLLQQTAYTTSLDVTTIRAVIRRRFKQVHQPLYTIAYICDPGARKEREVELKYLMKEEIASY
jgi:hypothetical protein